MKKALGCRDRLSKRVRLCEDLDGFRSPRACLDQPRQSQLKSGPGAWMRRTTHWLTIGGSVPSR